jgi:hypothetical protein
VLGFTGIRAAATDPDWLDAVLPTRGRASARTLALVALAQGCVLPPVLTLSLARSGHAALLLAARLEGLALVLAACAAAASVRMRARAALPYVPLAILLVAAGAPR